MLSIQNYACSGVGSCCSDRTRSFRLVISCSNGSGQCMTMEHFVDSRSPFPSPRFCEYSKFLIMGKRESVPNATIASSYSEDHCVVRGYGSINRWPFLLRGDWTFGFCNLYS
ncbi:hypothetical protein AVEN_135340-1 [Araneus ventricosus]|uniref:Uncharacterized protein n=1 Tax=Araneus ventricosus TaxID=182803 RepID=A0A4Y2KSH7_ARAVE|nr:hypothetical protein AVEN_135340-1 [Araneus ventricosus]